MTCTATSFFATYPDDRTKVEKMFDATYPTMVAGARWPLSAFVHLTLHGERVTDEDAVSEALSQ